MIAKMNMLPHSKMAAIVLIVVIFILVGMSRSKKQSRKKSRIWIPSLVSLFAGPALSVVHWAAVVFVFERDMPATDAQALFLPMLSIGIEVGVVSSIVVAIALRLR